MGAARAPYSGSSRKFILALDIGTTFSGAAYTLLDPGRPVPQIRYNIARVSSILYYDHDGNFRGVENGVDLQDSDTLVRMKWWKFMLSPIELPVAMKDRMSTDLPKGKTIVGVLADFMRHLFRSAKASFEPPESNRGLRWDSVSESIELVLTHPNGWGGSQQAHLRNAAVKAGIVPDALAGSRVHFVAEGEASFSFCAANTEAGKNLKPGEQVLIIDAGGGTIDISTYKVLSSGPLRVEELYEPECLIQGGELVTVRATDVIKKQLEHSKFNTPEDLAAFSQRFDEGVKKTFSVSNSPEDQHVESSPPRDNDPNCEIKTWKLRLTGAQVSACFEPSIQSAVDSIRDNFRQLLPTNSIAFLVGGFATSPWLSEQLERRLSDLGFRFCKLDKYTDEAVAIGAVLHYIHHFVAGKEEERGGDTAMTEEVGQSRRETGDPKRPVAKQEADMLKLRENEKELIGECRRKGDRITKLEQEMEAQAREAPSMQEQLKQVKELLEARTAELSGAQTFLSKVDRLSEMEVLGIVRDLNENIFQLAVGLTDAWGKLESSQATGRIKLDLTSKARAPVLVQLARGRDPTGLTFLVQSSLCHQAVDMTSSWAHNPKLSMLKSVYQRLSASEGQAITARWRSLTHNYLSLQPLDSTLLIGKLARILDKAGLFPPPQQSLESVQTAAPEPAQTMAFKFVQTAALDRIESMIRTVQRLETAFMVDIASSNMAILFEAPDTVFDSARMINEFGSKSASKPGKEGRIAGTTEVGVEKSICGQGETGRAEILLKVKVVLEKDVIRGGK